MGDRVRDSVIGAGVLTLAALSCPFLAPGLAASGNISATMTTELAFGSLLAPAAGSASLALDAATNMRTYAGTAIGAGATRGVITIANGEPASTYTWALSTPTVTLAGNAFTPTFYSVNAASAASGLFDAAGTDTLYFGATGAVAAGSAAGAANDAPTLTITPSLQNARNERLKYLLTIVTPATVTKVRDFSFGTITSTGFAGTVTVPAARTGTTTATGGASVVSGGTSGEFAAAGQSALAVTVSVSPGTLTLTGPGSAAMTATSWVTSPTSPFTMPNSGNQTIYVGGTLNVGASQAQGSYSGILTLTVNYQ